MELTLTPSPSAPDFFSDINESEESPVQEAPKPAFMIDSEDRANWYLRQMGNLAAEKERVKANSARMLADIKQREDILEGRFKKQLEDWTKAELIRRKSKKKSLPLFQGVINFRTVNPSYYILDGEAAMVYARTFCPDLIEQKPTLNAAAYIQASKASRETETLDEPTGELVPGNLLPGTDVKPGYESMSIKFVAPVGAIDADDAEGADTK